MSNPPGSFRKDFNWHGWTVALACAAGMAELAVRFVFPLLAKVV